MLTLPLLGAADFIKSSTDTRSSVLSCVASSLTCVAYTHKAITGLLCMPYLGNNLVTKLFSHLERLKPAPRSEHVIPTMFQKTACHLLMQRHLNLFSQPRRVEGSALHTYQVQPGLATPRRSFPCEALKFRKSSFTIPAIASYGSITVSSRSRAERRNTRCAGPCP